MKYKRKNSVVLFQTALLIFFAFIITACSTIETVTKGTATVLEGTAAMLTGTNEIGVAESLLGMFSKDGKNKKSAASTVDMMIYADDHININALNEATPITFMVIQMTNDLNLYTATFETLSGDIEAVLKKEYISHEKYVVAPGKFVHVEPMQLDKKTKFLAIVAAYQELDQIIWRTSKSVKDKKAAYAVHVVFKKKGIKMAVQK